MNPSILAAPPSPLADRRPSARPTRADARRSLSERLRKPASWLALVALVPIGTTVPRVESRMLSASLLAAGMLAVVAAMLGRVWCALYIAGRKNSELCQDGPYSLVRNPLHVFAFLGALGVALAGCRPWIVPVVAVLFIAYTLPW